MSARKKIKVSYPSSPNNCRIYRTWALTLTCIITGPSLLCVGSIVDSTLNQKEKEDQAMRVHWRGQTIMLPGQKNNTSDLGRGGAVQSDLSQTVVISKPA